MRLAIVSGWLLAGAALSGGAYWTFLNTPESTVWALMASASLLLISLLLVGTTVNAAILMWTHGPSWQAITGAARRAPAVVPAALVVIAMWWLVSHGERWITMRSGPINAWFIAEFGWDDMSWLFTTIAYAAAWAQWLLAPVIALWLMASFVHGAKHRLSLRRVAIASVWFGVLVVLPWRYLVPWRPGGIPPTSIEAVFIATKLITAAAIMAAGAALIIREASPRGGQDPPAGARA